MIMALWTSQYTEHPHIQTNIWTLTLTTISNTKGLLYEHSLTEQTAWSPNRSRNMLRSDMLSPHSRPMATRSVRLRPHHPKNTKSDTSCNTTGDQARTSVGLHCVRGTSEKLARVLKKHGVGAYHKPFNTILVHPKTRHLITKSGVSSMKSSAWNALRSVSVKLLVS